MDRVFAKDTAGVSVKLSAKTGQEAARLVVDRLVIVEAAMADGCVLDDFLLSTEGPRRVCSRVAQQLL